MSASEFEGHEALIAEMRAGTLDAPGYLHRRVLAGRPAKQRRSWASMSARRRVFVIVPIAAGLAVGAALIQGSLSSGQTSKTASSTQALQAEIAQLHQQVARALRAGGVTGATGPTGPQGPAGPAGGTGLNFGLEQNVAGSNFSSFKSSHANAGKGLYLPNGSWTTAAGAPVRSSGQLRAVADSSANGSVSIPSNRLVHADATLEVAVENNDALAAATNKASQIVTSLGGYAQNRQYQAAGSDGNSYLNLRVPVHHANRAIYLLGKLGSVVSSTVSTADLQHQFAKQTDVIGRLRRAITIYENALQSGSLTYSQRISTQIQLSNAQYQLKAMRKSRSHTVASAATADIRLTLTTDQHAFAAVVHPPGRVGRLFHNMGTFLGLEGLVILYILIVAVPIIVLLALIWASTVGRRRRDERRLLAST